MTVPTALLDRRTELQRLFDAEMRSLVDIEARLAEVGSAIAMCEAEAAMSGMPVPEPARERHEVAEPVMKWLATAEPGGSFTTTAIADLTRLPQSSIHAFLLKARREGKVERIGDTWRLPQSAGEPVPAAQSEAVAERAADLLGEAAEAERVEGGNG